MFAIAITLLVLEIRLPEPMPGSHASRLSIALVEELWPDFYSFLISFWFVGTLWIAHHRILTPNFWRRFTSRAPQTIQ